MQKDAAVLSTVRRLRRRLRKPFRSISAKIRNHALALRHKHWDFSANKLLHEVTSHVRIFYPAEKMSILVNNMTKLRPVRLLVLALAAIPLFPNPVPFPAFLA